jgi:hypothetical protein
MATTDSRNVDWPATDFEARPAIGEASPASSPVPSTGRRLSRLAADLAIAIRKTSEAARDAQLAHVADEAKGVSQRIQEQLVEGAAALRTQAEDDVTEIREWAKAEATRIKAEADARTAARKHLLEEQLANHAAATRSRSTRMEAKVNAYRATMDEFFRHFLEEEDPARLATIAETMPEPPSLEPYLDPDPDWADFDNLSAPLMTAAEADAAEAAAEPAWSADDAEAEAALAAGALEAEAEAAAHVDGVAGAVAVADPNPAAPAASEPSEPAAESKAAPAAAPETAKAAKPVQTSAAASSPAPDFRAELQSTQIIVSGLVSVASVASFRRALGRLPGVSAVTVTSAADGAFLFHASHRHDVDFQAALPALPGFVSQITGTADGAVSVVTVDPEAER